MIKLSPEGRALWQAVYAAAFVEGWRRAYDEADANPRGRPIGEGPADVASKHTSAEHAVYLADLAVLRFKQWTDAGPPQDSAGTDVDDESYEKVWPLA